MAKREGEFIVSPFPAFGCSRMAKREGEFIISKEIAEAGGKRGSSRA
jgi:hypothetical protein